MNNIIEACASFLECCIFVRLFNGFLGFKDNKYKWVKSTAFFIFIALDDIFLAQLEGFENISIAILLLVFLVYSLVFLNGKIWEKFWFQLFQL